MIAATPTPPLSPSEPAGRKTADVGVFGPIDGMGNRDLSGSYIGLSVSGKHFAHGFRISLGAAKVLSAELAGLLGHELAPPTPDSTGTAALVSTLRKEAFECRDEAEQSVPKDYHRANHFNAKAEGFDEAADLADAALTPSAPIAAPVRDDGARDALRTAFMEGFAAGHEDAEEAGRPLPGGHGVRGPQDPEVFWLRSDALASLPATAGDVPGEAQTQEGGR